MYNKNTSYKYNVNFSEKWDTNIKKLFYVVCNSEKIVEYYWKNQLYYAIISLR